MKKLLPLLMLIPALLLGLLLPRLVSAAQDAREQRDEAAGIRQVNLTVDSGLSNLQKIALFNDPEADTLGVGNGVHQTAGTLSTASWQIITSLLGMDQGLLESETAVQEQQTAVLLSKGAQAFLYWEVLFRDGQGNVLRLYLDDETAAPLAISYGVGKSRVQNMVAAAEYTLYTLCYTASLNVDGPLPGESSEAEGVEPYTIYDNQEAYEFGCQVSDAAGETQEIWASGGLDWFIVNYGPRLGG